MWQLILDEDGQWEYFITTAESEKLYSHYGIQYVSSTENWELIYLKNSYITLGYIHKEWFFLPEGPLLKHVHYCSVYRSQEL